MPNQRHWKATLVCAFMLSFVPSTLCAEDDHVVHGPSDRSLRFGVVIKNQSYAIYRSAALGKSGLKHLSKMLSDENLPFPKTIISMNKLGYAFPFYYAIKEYKASLSGRYGEFEYFHTFGKGRTYIDGQNPYYASKNIDLPINLGPIGSRYFSLGDKEIDGDMNAVMRVLSLVLNPDRQPVLFHCYGGLHRTGMIAMILRYLQGGFWVDGPKYNYHGMKLNPAQYEYAKFNPHMFRKNNIEFIEKFSKDPIFLALQKQYQKVLSNDEKIFFGDDEDNDSDDADLDAEINEESMFLHDEVDE